MTSYTQNDYYFNKIDALSYNNRPISSTLRTKTSYSAYDSQTEEDECTSYDLYGNNQEYNDGTSSCESYNPYQQQRSTTTTSTTTATMSNAGNYNQSCYDNDLRTNSINQYCKNVNIADNLMYHRDACSGDSSERYNIYSSMDYGEYDNLRGDTESAFEDFNNKMLPPVPMVHHSQSQSHNMWDGMLVSGQNHCYRPSNVSLPSTPTFRYNDSSAGGRVLGCYNGDCDRGFLANDVKAQLNGGQRYYDQNSDRNEFNGYKPGERILPMPQSQNQTQSQSQNQPQSSVKKSVKQQFFKDNFDNMATTTTTTNSMPISSVNLDYKRSLGVSSTSIQNNLFQNLYYDNGGLIDSLPNSHELDFNNSYSMYDDTNYAIQPRPHTAMQCTEQEYNDFSSNAMDNMSTYSDTTTAAVAKQKFQDSQNLQNLQKCRYSIIMAMTTASVIASGETRIPHQFLKKTPKTMAETIKAHNKAISNRYEEIGEGGSSGGFSGLGSNNLMSSCAYTTSSANLPTVTLSSSTSSSMLLLSSASPIVADSKAALIPIATSCSLSDTAPTGKNFTSRKLPKHHTGRGLTNNKHTKLTPSPQYPLGHNNTSKLLPNIPQSTSMKNVDSNSFNINSTSSILTTTTSEIIKTSETLTSTSSITSSNISSTSGPAFSASVTLSSTKTDAISAATSGSGLQATTSSSQDLLANNNNNISNLNIYDNFNNFNKKNNNFFNNNVQTTNDKYSLETSFQINEQKDYTQEEDEEEEGKNDSQIKTDKKAETIYHSKTMPSKLPNSLADLNDTLTLSSRQIETELGKGTANDLFILTKTTASETSSEPFNFSNSEKDYKSTFVYDYADYLKPYKLPTFPSATNNLENSVNQTKSITSYLAYPSVDLTSDYLAFSSSITTPSLSSTTYSSSTSTSTSSSAAALTTAINNRGFNDQITALNLSDNNISYKNNSISMPVNKIANTSGSVVSITSMSPTTALSSSLSNIPISIQCSTSDVLETTTSSKSCLQTSIPAASFSPNLQTSVSSELLPTSTTTLSQSSQIQTPASLASSILPKATLSSSDLQLSIASNILPTATTTISSSFQSSIASTITCTLASATSSNLQTSIASSILSITTAQSSNLQKSVHSPTSTLSNYFNKITTADHQEEKVEEKKQQNSLTPLYLENYDDYLKDYKINFLTTSSPKTHTTETTNEMAFTTTSSSILNNTWPTSTMSSITTTNDNISYMLNNNESLITTSVLTFYTPDCLFTTTKITAPDAADGTSTSPSFALYDNYLKDFKADTVTTSSNLPEYIKDFLTTSTKSNEYEYDSCNYINFYQFQEDKEEEKGEENNQEDTSKTSTSKNNIMDLSNITEIEILPKAATTVNSFEQSVPPIKTTSTSVATTSSSLMPLSSSDLIENENQLTAFTSTASTAKMVDFDENFYNSFNVNLNSLMSDSKSIEPTGTVGSTKNIETTTSTAVTKTEIDSSISKSSYTLTTTAASKTELNSDFPKSLYTSINTDSNINTEKSNKSPFSISSPITFSSDATAEAATTLTQISAELPPKISTSSSSQKSTTTTAGIKAASMLGGLSQTLKGGLDNVLLTQQQQPQQKRGFGFGLASKLVPNVGGLLSSASKTVQPTTTITKTEHSKPIINNQSPQISQSYNNETTTSSVVTTGQEFGASTWHNDVENNYSDVSTTTVSNGKNVDFGVSCQTTDIYDNVNGGGVYYNSSQPTTYYHMTSSLDYAQDEMLNNSEQIMMYDREMNGEHKDYYAEDENQLLDLDGYGGYSEYGTNNNSAHFVDTTLAYTTSSITKPSGPENSMEPADVAPVIESELAPPPISTTSQTTVTAAKKTTSSIFSSLTNVASQISQQTTSASSAAPVGSSSAQPTTCISKTPSSSGTGGGMFGSIFGRAAAAMQTATQVVNQGASMATTKVQKNLQTPASQTFLKKVPTTQEPTCAPSSIVTTSETNYTRNQITHQDSLASSYASSLGVDVGGVSKQDFEEEDYYYANKNKTNQLMQQHQSQQKLLPTVPPAGGSTGKKLPTINDKSGCLVKQQPTEIYDQVNDVLDHNSKKYLKRIPTYDIDSEQVDYYLDAQSVAPSARHLTTQANGYYEHTNGGTYDYRDDYFNEEDEFNYLEKEKLQDKQQQQLRQIQKQTSLQYVLDDDDDYPLNQNELIEEYLDDENDDIYNSEDSGNYLDESSSESVKNLKIQPQQKLVTASEDLQQQTAVLTTTTTTSQSNTTTSLPSSTPVPVSHQQIRKQDSIILEEDEKEEIPDAIVSPSKSQLSLDRDILEDDEDDDVDQMGDLHQVSAGLRSSQSRKMKLMRGETEEVVGGHMQVMKRNTEVTAKQRWHWAYNKIILQLNVSIHTKFL